MLIKRLEKLGWILLKLFIFQRKIWLLNFKKLKEKRKMKSHQNLNNYFDETNYRRQHSNFQFEEDPFSKDAWSIRNFYHEGLVLLKFLQTRSQVKYININFYDLFYTVIKNRYDKEMVITKYEDNDVHYNNINDFIVPNDYVGRKNNFELIR